MKPRKREWLWMVIAVALAAYITGRDAETDRLISAETKSRADERYAEIMAPLPELSMPLQCDAWVTQNGKSRCYFFTATKGQQ